MTPALRSLEPRRCECGARLFVKLSRSETGKIRRDLYCANTAAHPEACDVTASAARRALHLAKAALLVSQGAA